MCPSVECPNCRHFTFHRGSCENPECGYDPMKATVSGDFSEVPASNMDGLQFRHADSPFARICVFGEDETAVRRIAQHLGYQGPFFYRESDGSDFLEADETYGFDLVKDKAKQVWDSYLAWSV